MTAVNKISVKTKLLKLLSVASVVIACSTISAGICKVSASPTKPFKSMWNRVAGRSGSARITTPGASASQSLLPEAKYSPLGGETSTERRLSTSSVKSNGSGIYENVDGSAGATGGRGSSRRNSTTSVGSNESVYENVPGSGSTRTFEQMLLETPLEDLHPSLIFYKVQLEQELNGAPVFEGPIFTRPYVGRTQSDPGPRQTGPYSRVILNRGAYTDPGYETPDF